MKKLLTVFAAVVFFACQKNTAEKTSQSSTQNPKELTDSLILVKVFGKTAKQKGDGCHFHDGDFSGNPKVDSAQFSAQNWKNLEIEHGHELEYFVEHKSEILVDGKGKLLVILAASGFTCHVCPGVCGAAVFSKNGDDWQLETYENDIAVLGTTGYPVDEIQITACGENAYAIILKRGSIWQGVAWRYFTVVIFQNGTFQEVLKNPVYFSASNWNNYEGCGPICGDAYAFTAFIDFSPRKNSIWDMVVKYTGTVLDERSKAVLLNRDVRFEFKNGFFVTDEKLPD